MNKSSHSVLLHIKATIIRVIALAVAVLLVFIATSSFITQQ